MRERGNNLFHEIAKECEFMIEEMEIYNVMSIFIRYSISRVVGIMKNVRARVFFKSFRRSKNAFGTRNCKKVDTLLERSVINLQTILSRNT